MLAHETINSNANVAMEKFPTLSHAVLSFLYIYIFCDFPFLCYSVAKIAHNFKNTKNKKIKKQQQKCIVQKRTDIVPFHKDKSQRVPDTS